MSVSDKRTLLAVVAALLALVAGAHLLPLVVAAEITVIVAFGGAIGRVVAQTGWRTVPCRPERS